MTPRPMADIRSLDPLAGRSRPGSKADPMAGQSPGSAKRGLPFVRQLSSASTVPPGDESPRGGAVLTRQHSSTSTAVPLADDFAPETETDQAESPSFPARKCAGWPPAMPEDADDVPASWEQRFCDEDAGSVADGELDGAEAAPHAEDWPPILSVPPDEAPRLCVGMPQLQSSLGKWAQWAVCWEEGQAHRSDDVLDDGESDWTTFGADGGSVRVEMTSDEEETAGQAMDESADWPPALLPQADEAPRLCAGMPQLQSSLGKWAQWAVRWEEGEVDRLDMAWAEIEVADDTEAHAFLMEEGCEPARSGVATPLLKSELGTWAQQAVRREEFQSSGLEFSRMAAHLS